MSYLNDLNPIESLGSASRRMQGLAWLLYCALHSDEIHAARPYAEGVSDVFFREADDLDAIYTKLSLEQHTATQGDDSKANLAALEKQVTETRAELRRATGADKVREVQELRDRLIADQADKGADPAHLAQAFGMKRAQVEQLVAKMRAAPPAS